MNSVTNMMKYIKLKAHFIIKIAGYKNEYQNNNLYISHATYFIC